MKIILAIINFLALIGAITWWTNVQEWEPAVTSIGLFGALLTQIFTNDEIKNKLKFFNKSGDNSTNYQSAGNQTITDNKKIQTGGKKSENYQADVLVVNKGLSYEETKSIALDVYKANMTEFRSVAATIADERAELITEKILKKISETNPQSLKEFQNPAMQDALFKTQKEFAKSGDQDLGDLLVDIISDRANVVKRNMLQIVLDESLTIAPKLTIEQLDTLTLIFLTTRTRRLIVRNLGDFSLYINNCIAPFIDNLLDDHEHFIYIEYLGCAHIRAGNWVSLPEIWRKSYKAIFSRGFTREEFESEVIADNSINQILIPCLNDPEKLQFKFMDEEVLESEVKKINISADIIGKIKTLFEKSTKQQDDIKNQLSGINPKMNRLFEVWEKSSFKNLELTSVGIAIAHANYRRRTGETMDLSIWIK
jgi:hypothetical protein